MSILRISSLALCLAACCLAVEPPALVDLGETLGDAGTTLRVRLAAAPGATVAWTLADWGDAIVAEGNAPADAAGVATVELDAPAGWYELRAGGGRSGIILRDGPAGVRPDPFFCVDAALGELATGAQADRRERFAALIPRLGLDLARERLHWYGVHPAPDRLRWEGRFQEDALYAAYARQGVGVLEMFHSAPGWLGRSAGVYPADSRGCARSWQEMMAHWRQTLRAVEVWNEPDATEYSGDETPDQLVALTRAVGWGVRRGAPEALVCGGAITPAVSEDYLSMVFANGLLAASDVFTFHDYRDPAAMLPGVAKLRGLMAAAGDPSVPLWVTESGHGRPVGAGAEADAAADRSSAAAIVLRAVEARACGVARHFAFVLAWYEESGKNFGLSGRDGSPQRALAAYSHAARRLAGLDYAGDLELRGARRVRVFAGGGRAVAVAALASGAGLDAGDLPLRSVHGLDGRHLARAATGGWRAPEDVLLLELEPAALARVRPDPATWALFQAGRGARPRPALPAVQTRIVPTAGEVSPLLTRYALATLSGGAALRLRVTNLGEAPARLAALDLLPPDGGRLITVPTVAGQEVPAGGEIELTWRIAASAIGTWRTSGRLADGTELPPTVFIAAPEQDGDALLAALPAAASRILTPAELSACDRNIAHGATMATAALADGGWRMDFDFSGKDAGTWAFPRIPLPADARGGYDGVLLRARTLHPAGTRIFAFVPGGTGNIGWWTPLPVMPSDGAWHWVLVRFAELERCPAAELDGATTLDPARIDRISLGVNSRFSPRNAIEVASCTLVRLPPAPTTR